MGPDEFIYSLREAFSLDYASSEVERLSNLQPPGLSPEQLASRKGILTIAYKLIRAERDLHLKIVADQVKR